MIKDKKVMINLGCGFTGHNDWINVDWGVLSIINKFPVLKKVIFSLNIVPKNYNRTWPKNLRLINLRKRFPFSDNSIDYIYTAHFIEHLEKHEAIKLFKQCYRSLKPGGTIRILVPDLDIVSRQYIESDDKIRKVEILNNHFYGLIEKKDVAPTFYERMLLWFARGHKWLYNFEYMKRNLMLAGFEDQKIKRCQFQQGETPNIDFLDNYPDHTLYVEAKK
jgi:predicted SAM-dependent methyltransferase